MTSTVTHKRKLGLEVYEAQIQCVETGSLLAQTRMFSEQSARRWVTEQLRKLGITA